MMSNIKSNTIEFIQKSKLIFRDMYDYSKVDYKTNKIKVEIICKEHGSFLVRPNLHLRNSGCPKCSIMKRTFNNLNKNWKEDFIKVHGNKYDYSKCVYVNSKTKVEIICKEHGSFYMRPSNHIIQKQDCIKCSGKKIFNNIDFISESIKVHGDKYDYSKCVYVNSNKKVEIICKEHGSFYMTPNTHRYSGCPECGKISSINSRRKKLDLLLDEFNKIHNFLYDYSKLDYKSNKKKVEIICKEHGSFNIISRLHIIGQGCPKCFSSSRGEIRISNLLSSNNIDYEVQKTFDNCVSNIKLRFDFYLPEHNICIEYDGIQHFKPIEYFGGVDAFCKLKDRDDIKNKYCESHNIKLIRIPFNRYKEIEDILTLEINI